MREESVEKADMLKEDVRATIRQVLRDDLPELLERRTEPAEDGRPEEVVRARPANGAGAAQPDDAPPLAHLCLVTLAEETNSARSLESMAVTVHEKLVGEVDVPEVDHPLGGQAILSDIHAHAAYLQAVNQRTSAVLSRILRELEV